MIVSSATFNVLYDYVCLGDSQTEIADKGYAGYENQGKVSKCIREHGFNAKKTGKFASGESRGRFPNMSRNEFRKHLEGYQGDNFDNFVEQVEGSSFDGFDDDYEGYVPDFSNDDIDYEDDEDDDYEYTKNLRRRSSRGSGSSGGSGAFSELLDAFRSLSKVEKLTGIVGVLAFVLVFALLTSLSIWVWWGRLIIAIIATGAVSGVLWDKISKD